jgi:acylphosphatase
MYSITTPERNSDMDPDTISDNIPGFVIPRREGQPRGSMKTVEIKITGRVQGIGMRNCIRHLAGKLNIRGEVMNLPDGAVRIVATLDPILLDKFISTIYGCPRALIKDIETAEIQTRSFREFSILKTDD